MALERRILMALVFHNGFEIGGTENFYSNSKDRHPNPFEDKPLCVRHEEPGRTLEVEIDRKKLQAVTVELPSVVIIA